MSIDNPKCETCRHGMRWTDAAFKKGDPRAEMVTCKRYPQSVDKQASDFCGEHSELNGQVAEIIRRGFVGDVNQKECEHEWERNVIRKCLKCGLITL